MTTDRVPSSTFAGRELTKQAVHERAGRETATAIDVSRVIFDAAETAFEETASAAALQAVLSSHGFVITPGGTVLPTSFVAEIGAGPLVVAICAEYDALPEIGHACGHNIISGAAALAALALAPDADMLGITLRVYGTPAEERGGGKVIMLEQGLFDDVDVALMVHPAPEDTVEPTIVAVTRLEIEFLGESPPAGNPERGRNAGAAATLFEVAVALARQSLRTDERVAGVVLSAGHSAGVLPDRASLSFIARAGSDRRLDEIVEQLRTCARGAAIATNTTEVVTEPAPRYGALQHHSRLGDLYQANAESLGRVFVPSAHADIERAAGSDFGNISARIPAIHPLIGLTANGASNHQAAFTAVCGGPEGDRAITDAGTALALTVVDLATDSALRAELQGGEL